MSSSIVLGFVSESDDNDDYEPTFYDTYFGGRPTFASPTCAHAAPECATCATPARFVLQAYNSIDDAWHLQLHLYACPRCTAWFVTRCVAKIDSSPSTDTNEVTSPARKAAFGFDFDDDWGSSSSASATPQTTPVKAKPAVAAPAVEPVTPVKVVVDTPASFEIQYIEVDYEPEEEECGDDDADAAAQAALLESSSTTGGGASQDEDYLPEDYEATDPFHKFLQRLERAPGQLCRYGGKPLWPSSERPAAIPPCSVCGAAREFELQILPTLLTFLMPREARVPDFGSVFVFTCHCTGAPDRSIDEFAFVVAGQ
jgi:hypothetical protein